VGGKKTRPLKGVRNSINEGEVEPLKKEKSGRFSFKKAHQAGRLPGKGKKPPARGGHPPKACPQGL